MSQARPSWASGYPPDWIVPDWPVPPQVRAVFTTRAAPGSVGSSPPFDGFNLGDRVGDDPAQVAVNHAKLAELIAARPIFNHQVHGWGVNQLRGDSLGGADFDASICTESGLACAAMAADCCPMLFCCALDRQPVVVGAAHAGWRGLLGERLVKGQKSGQNGVVEAIFESFCTLVTGFIGFDATHSVASNLQVWIGPCIGPSAFEVGAEVRQAFCDAHADDAAWFAPRATQGKYLANLPSLVRARLARLGVSESQIHGNDGSSEWCTASQPQRFFSHRRDTALLGGSGRMAGLIWLS